MIIPLSVEHLELNEISLGQCGIFTAESFGRWKDLGDGLDRYKSAVWG